MADIRDVADYILEVKGELTTMKLQKLVYYSQAWHLAWTEMPLFEDKIEAWRNGPVAPKLFEAHKGCFKLKKGFFRKSLKKPDTLTHDQKSIIERVLKYYGDKDPHWLSQLTHMESPWKAARERSGNSNDDRSSEEITKQSMFEYYSSL